MRPITITASASASGNSHSGIFIPDRHLNPFNIGFGAVIATTAHYTVQHTFRTTVEDATAAEWFPNEFIVEASANEDGNYAFPVAGIRVEVSAASEGGVSVTFIQAGVRD